MATKTAYIVAYWSTYSKEFQYTIQGYTPGETNGYILLEAREIDFETPNDTTLRLRIAEALRGQKAKILADAFVEAKAVDETIQELLALEDKSGEITKEEDDDIPF